MSGCRHPRRLLLLDAVGAFMSACWLAVLLPHWQPLVGLPLFHLYALGAVAAALVPVGLAGWWLGATRWRRTLRWLALLNSAYALGTAILLIVYRQQVQWLGWLYFGLELLVLAVLVRWEWRMSGAGTASH